MRNALRPALCAALLLALPACSNEPLPPLGASEVQLVRLDAQPEATTSPTRLRLFVADASLGIPLDADATPTGDEIREQIEALAARAAAFGPDIMVIYDVPQGGKAFRVAGPVNRARPGTEWERFDAPEHLAVGTDLLHRVETIHHSGRLSSGHALPSLGALAFGPVLLSEAALSLHAEPQLQDGPQGRWGAPAGRFTASYSNGPSLVFLIQVADHANASADPSALRIERGTDCLEGIASEDGALCVHLPQGAEVLRAAKDTVIGAAGGALRIEFSLPPSAPPAAATP